MLAKWAHGQLKLVKHLGAEVVLGGVKHICHFYSSRRRDGTDSGNKDLDGTDSGNYSSNGTDNGKYESDGTASWNYD